MPPGRRDREARRSPSARTHGLDRGAWLARADGSPLAGELQETYTLYAKNWIVYAPFGGPEHVFGYLGNCTHRIAISNRRLVERADGKVSFTWKDYAQGVDAKS